MFTTYFIIFSFSSELQIPEIFGDVETAIASQPFNRECIYTVIDNLIIDPTIHWVNSIDSIVSSTSSLSLTPLMTSDGGQYTCIVNINFIELKISLTGNGTTNITVKSKF